MEDGIKPFSYNTGNILIIVFVVELLINHQQTNDAILTTSSWRSQPYGLARGMTCKHTCHYSNIRSSITIIGFLSNVGTLDILMQPEEELENYKLVVDITIITALFDSWLF